MNSLTGYRITEALYDGMNCQVFRGKRQEDNLSVVLKLLKGEYPAPDQVSLFKREYEIIRSFNLDGIIKAYGLEKHFGSFVMILEDFGGESLEKILISQRSKFKGYEDKSLSTFLLLAVKVTDILGRIHQQHIVHNDINPSNIVRNPETDQIKLIDFSISSVVSRKTASIHNPTVISGSPPYISPEQTGRMNRGTDARSDLYSLGVTLYQLLTGFLPFPGTDPMEIVHCHLARIPKPPHRLRQEIPKVLSAIILKLMAKNPEERYQSAFGLKMDLQNCLDQLTAKGKIEDFNIGQKDMSDRFQIPRKLFGREKEIKNLLSAFERVKHGAMEMMLITGDSGIGKSALVNEIRKTIIQQNSYFISGKFDPLESNSFHAPLIQAFRDLVRQWLTQSDDRIAIRRETLLKALGPNGQLMIELIPDLELIIGRQPPIPDLAAAESRNRFNIVFQNFVQAFASKKHPLVVFMDDLQWADASSLKMLAYIMCNFRMGYILIFGAFRDNVVHPAHPLMLTIDEIIKAGAIVRTTTLKRLDLIHINELIAQTLSCDPEYTRSLAQLCLQKTAGNPFFLNQFLYFLYEENLIEFDFSKSNWKWEIDQIQHIQIADSIVELMVDKIQKLSNRAQEILKLAACIGNLFDLKTLSIVNEKSQEKTADELQESLQSGLVVPKNDASEFQQKFNDNPEVLYMFLHDRVRQAIYSMVTDDYKKAAHLKIGRLLKNTDPADDAEKLFRIVNHLNLGAELIREEPERISLARLNLCVGQKAMATGAYESSYTYLKSGISLLSENCWHTEYNLALALHVTAVETAGLSADYDEMERLAEIVLHKAATFPDNVKCYEVKILAYIAQNKPLQAIETALNVLKQLGGGKYPKNPGKLDIISGIIRTKIALAGKKIETVTAMPEMTDPNMLARFRIMSIIVVPSYFAVGNLQRIITLDTIVLSIRYGTNDLLCYAYGAYAGVLCGVLGQIEAGYRFGMLSIKLVERLNAIHIKSKIQCIFNGFVRPWKDHLRKSIAPLWEAYQSGLDTGDLAWAGYSIFGYIMTSYLSGESLLKLELIMQSNIKPVAQLKQEPVIYRWKMIYQAILNLRGGSSDPCQLTGEIYDERIMLPKHLIANDRIIITLLFFQKLMLSCLFADYPQ
ncbi:MAG: serine/threonine-protein kinase PknK, partial [Desulfobacula sp.]